MLRYLIDNFFKKHARNLLDREVMLESDAPFDPFDAHLSCSLDHITHGPSKTHLPQGTHMSGTLSSTLPIQIDGHFEGTLNADQLTAGQSARICADLHLHSATISGTLVGNIIVKERLRLTSTARIEGDVAVGALTLEEGAIVTGSIQIQYPDEPLLNIS